MWKPMLTIVCLGALQVLCLPERGSAMSLLSSENQETPVPDALEQWRAQQSLPEMEMKRIAQLEAAAVAVAKGDSREKVIAAIGVSTIEYQNEWIYVAGANNPFPHVQELLVVTFDGDTVIEVKEINTEIYVSPPDNELVRQN